MLTIEAAGPAVAQDEAEQQASATRRVSPEECVAEPRSYEEIAAILALDGDGIPAPEQTQLTPPLGELAAAETAAPITNTVRAIFACFNAGDTPTGAALLTDNGVGRAFWGLTVDQENRDLAQSRIPDSTEQCAEEFLIRLTAVTDVTLLPDGR